MGFFFFFKHLIKDHKVNNCISQIGKCRHVETPCEHIAMPLFVFSLDRHI